MAKQVRAGALPAGLGQRLVEAVASQFPGVLGTHNASEVALAASYRATTPDALLETVPARRGDHVMVWDGRLDNREELLDELTGLHPGATDADLVLAAYARWGQRFLDHLVGEFAIVLWDEARLRLLCAKDPLGWRPLYWTVLEGTLLIASDPTLLFAVGVARRPNMDYARRYLADAGALEGSTAFEGVQHLGGGGLLIADEAGIHLDAYWRVPRRQDLGRISPDEAVEGFESIVEGATRAMARSISPPAVMLSGGLDSSYVALLLARYSPNAIAVSSYAPGTAWDERDYQRMVIEQTGLEHHLIDVSDCSPLNPSLVASSAFDTPDTPPQAALLIATARAVRAAGSAVAFTGGGGDEWLTGSGRFVADAILRGHPARAWSFTRHLSTRGHRVSALARAAYRGLVPYSLREAGGTLRGNRSWDGLIPVVEPAEGWAGRPRREHAVAWQRHRALERRWAAYRSEVPSVVYWNERHAFRPAGVDARAPLNDLRVIEYLASLPEWILRFDGSPKALLRAGLRRAGAPGALSARLDKGAFDEPYDEGIRGTDRERAIAAVERTAQTPGVRSTVARREFEAWLEDDANARWEPTWRLIATGLWLEHCSAEDALPQVNTSPNAGFAPGAALTAAGDSPADIRRTERRFREEAVHGSDPS